MKPKYPTSYLQLPSHIFDAGLSAIELLVYADVWTMQNNGQGYWKSNATICEQFNTHRTTVIRAIKRLESRGLLRRIDHDGSRHLEAHVVESGGSVDATGSVHATGSADAQGGSADATGGVALTHQGGSADATQIDKNRKENRTINRKGAALVLPWESESFQLAWQEWTEYKQAQFKFKYKTVKSEQIALHKLHRDTHGDERNAIEAIASSIANGYRGIFPSNKSKGRHAGRNLDW